VTAEVPRGEGGDHCTDGKKVGIKKINLVAGPLGASPRGQEGSEGKGRKKGREEGG